MKELSLHLLDLIENSVGAGATCVTVEIDEDPAGDRLVISLEDNGHGMSEEAVKRATDPFFTTRATRGVGMGVPLFAAAAEQADGEFTLESSEGEGTRVRAEFAFSHLDRAPLGRIEDTLVTVVTLHPELCLHFRHAGPAGSYSVDSLELLAEFGLVGVRQEMVRRVREGREEIASRG